MNFRQAFLLLVAVFSGCVEASEPAPVAYRALAVVGGEPAAIAEYPGTVALTDATGRVFCTGTVIMPRAVLTAAHCLRDMANKPIAASQVFVVAGHERPDDAPATEVIPALSLYSHTGYDPPATVVDADGMGKANDIGLIVLSRDVSAPTVPILPRSQVDSALVKDAMLHIVGFGTTSTGSSKTGVLYKGLTPFQRRIESEMLVGAAGYPDSCSGDSGGPAYVLVDGTLYVAGITSRAWAKSVHSCGDGGIYTLAPWYLDWIEGLLGVLHSDGGLDDASSCVPSGSLCDPRTNQGCSVGQVCQVRPAGGLGCVDSSSVVQLGDSCVPSGIPCAQGAYCAPSLRCQRFCCADSDCRNGGTCSPIRASLGELGICPWEAYVADAGHDSFVPDVETVDTGVMDTGVDASELDAPIADVISADSAVDASVDAGEAGPRDHPGDAMGTGGCAMRRVGAPDGVRWLLLLGLTAMVVSRRRSSR